MKKLLISLILISSLSSAFAWNIKGSITNVTVDGSNNITITGDIAGWVGVIDLDNAGVTNLCLFYSGNKPCTSGDYGPMITSYASLPSGTYRGYVSLYGDPLISPPNFFSPSILDSCLVDYPTNNVCGGPVGSFDFQKTVDGNISIIGVSSPIDLYVSSSTVNAEFENLTGFNMVGTSRWIGDYLIKNFIGNIYGFFYDFRNWLIVLFIMGGVLYFVNKAFRFYRH